MNIPKEKFRPAGNRDINHDKKLETKPVGYLKDAWLRFRKNKGSVFAFGIICLSTWIPFITIVIIIARVVLQTFAFKITQQSRTSPPITFDTQQIFFVNYVVQTGPSHIAVIPLRGVMPDDKDVIILFFITSSIYKFIVIFLIS